MTTVIDGTNGIVLPATNIDYFNVILPAGELQYSNTALFFGSTL